MKKLFACICLLLFACSGVEPGSSGAVTLRWPDRDDWRPTRLESAGSYAALAADDTLTLVIDHFNIDLSWQKGNQPVVRKYLLPANVNQHSDKQLLVSYNGEGGGQKTSLDYSLQVPGVPVANDILMHVEVFASGLTLPVFTGSSQRFSVVAGQMVSMAIGLKFTRNLDLDGDGFLPLSAGGTDCDDQAAQRHPAAVEYCDGLDTACNGELDEIDHCKYVDSDGYILQTIPEGRGNVGLEGVEQVPLRSVTFRSFRLDRYEISNEQFRDCVSCGTPAVNPVADLVDYNNKATYDKHPVLNVTWAQAVSFCASRGMTLPTELQWEYAARGPWPNLRFAPWAEEKELNDFVGFGSDNIFPANIINRSDYGPVQVAALEKGASPFGVYNMAGNAGEWTASSYVANRYKEIDVNGGSEPPEPPEGLYKVVKGGSWNDRFVDTFLYRRYAHAATETSAEIGFRCAVVVP